MRSPLLNPLAAVAVLGVCALAVWTASPPESAVLASLQDSVAAPRAVRRFAHVVDLTHALSEDTPYIPIPGITFPFSKTTIATIAKNGVAANRWDIHEHLGT